MLNTRMTLAAFLQEGLEQGLMVSGTDQYIYTQGHPKAPWQPIWEDAKGLLYASGSDVNDEVFPLSQLNTVGLWISGPDLASMPHYDSSGDHNLNLQIHGEKRVTLFPPDDWPHLNTLLAMSLHEMDVFFDLHRDKPTKASSVLAETHPTVADLKPGEALFIPSYWFHFVEHNGPFNLNLTCWFQRRGPMAKRPGQSCRNVGRILRLAAAALIAGARNRTSPRTRAP